MKARRRIAEARYRERHKVAVQEVRRLKHALAAALSRCIWAAAYLEFVDGADDVSDAWEMVEPVLRGLEDIYGDWSGLISQADLAAAEDEIEQRAKFKAVRAA